MSSTNIQQVKVNRGEKWQIYYRLQELEIPCQCISNQPLEVTTTTPTAAIQLWSVVKQLTAPRAELINWLERCWPLNIEE